eukprot:gene18113-biopygen1333
MQTEGQRYGFEAVKQRGPPPVVVKIWRVGRPRRKREEEEREAGPGRDGVGKEEQEKEPLALRVHGDGGEKWFRIRRTTKPERLMRKYEEVTGHARMQYVFKGKQVEPLDTPQRLGMEDEDDVKATKRGGSEEREQSGGGSEEREQGGDGSEELEQIGGGSEEPEQSGGGSGKPDKDLLSAVEPSTFGGARCNININW